MTLKELCAVSQVPVYLDCHENPDGYVLLTNYLRGSNGVMSLAVEEIRTLMGSRHGSLVACVDISARMIEAIRADAEEYDGESC